MKKFLEKINKTLEPYYALITMLIFFITLFGSAYKFIISPSDLRIVVLSEQVTYPSTIGRSYAEIYRYMHSKDTLMKESTDIYSFLLKTTEFKRIEIKNTSSKTLRTVKFKLLNTDDLSAWGITSNFLTSVEEESLKKNLSFDNTNQIVSLLNPVDLPSNSQITILLWGNFKADLLNNNIVCNYSDGDGHLEETYQITGIKGYFINYAFEFIAILTLIFVFVYYVGIKFARK